MGTLEPGWQTTPTMSPWWQDTFIFYLYFFYVGGSLILSQKNKFSPFFSLFLRLSFTFTVHTVWVLLSLLNLVFYVSLVLSFHNKQNSISQSKLWWITNKSCCVQVIGVYTSLDSGQIKSVWVTVEQSTLKPRVPLRVPKHDMNGLIDDKVYVPR